MDLPLTTYQNEEAGWENLLKIMRNSSFEEQTQVKSSASEMPRIIYGDVVIQIDQHKSTSWKYRHS